MMNILFRMTIVLLLLYLYCVITITIPIPITIPVVLLIFVMYFLLSTFMCILFYFVSKREEEKE